MSPSCVDKICDIVDIGRLLEAVADYIQILVYNTL